MDSQDTNKIRQRAKTETEAFINRHLNDTAKGWPKIYLYGSTYDKYSQERKIRKRSELIHLATN